MAASVLWRLRFLFSRWRHSNFLNFMKTWANLTKANLRKSQQFVKLPEKTLYFVWVKFEKVLNSGKSRLTQRLILRYYFHLNILKGKTAIFKSCNFFGQTCLLHSGNQVFAYHAYIFTFLRPQFISVYDKYVCISYA